MTVIFQCGRAGVCAGKDSQQSCSAHKTFCGGGQSHPSADRFPRSKFCRIPPADPTSAAHNDGFAKSAKYKNARYTDTLRLPNTAPVRQIVCRRTPAQSCNLPLLKYTPGTALRAAHRAESSFLYNAIACVYIGCAAEVTRSNLIHSFPILPVASAPGMGWGRRPFSGRPAADL